MKTYTVIEYEMEDYDAFRDGLSNAEAASLLSSIERGWIPDYNFTGTESDFENYKLHAALYRAIEVLERN